LDQRFLVFAIVIVPVLSVCLGFTVHFAIRPMVEALIDAIRDLAKIAKPEGPSDRVMRLEAEVDELRGELRRLRAETSFDNQLKGSPSDFGRLPPGSA
jgi:hypothetical protein